MGRSSPRLLTPPLRKLTRRTTRGYEVVDFAEMIGEPLLPWQQWLVKHALELNPDGTYRFRTVLVLVARQNGKSSVKRTVSLWRLYMDGAKLILGVAQDVSLAREQWTMALDTIKASPDLAAELEQERRVNGDEWFRLASGGRYKIAASNRRAGRGLSIDELNIDELREQRSWDAWSALSKTTMARANAQTWAMSNAGDDESVVLNQLREAALSSRDPSIGLFEWSAPDGCDLDDPRAWCQANPALGTTVSVQAIRSALGTDPPNVFRTEVLCQRVDQLDGAVDLAAWRACADPSGSLDRVRNRVALCLDVAPELDHATLAAAAVLDDGRVRVEIVDAWTTTGATRTALPAWLDKIKPRVTGWFPGGPAAAMFPDLAAKRGMQELKAGEVPAICQGFSEQVSAGRILHNADPMLATQVSGAVKLYQGDGWRFARRGVDHVDGVYASAGAVHLARTLPAKERPMVIVARRSA